MINLFKKKFEIHSPSEQFNKFADQGMNSVLVGHYRSHAIIEYQTGIRMIINVSNNSSIDTDETFVYVFSDEVVVAIIRKEDLSSIYLG